MSQGRGGTEPPHGQEAGSCPSLVRSGVTLCLQPSNEEHLQSPSSPMNTSKSVSQRGYDLSSQWNFSKKGQCFHMDEICFEQDILHRSWCHPFRHVSFFLPLPVDHNKSRLEDRDKLPVLCVIAMLACSLISSRGCIRIKQQCRLCTTITSKLASRTAFRLWERRDNSLLSLLLHTRLHLTPSPTPLFRCRKDWFSLALQFRVARDVESDES